jgi:hypothetical protein
MLKWKPVANSARVVIALAATFTVLAAPFKWK